MSNFGLNDAVALVTGGAQGLGRSVAREFAEHGANVVIADIADEQGSDTAEVLRESRIGDVQFVRTDVADPTACNALVETILEQFNGLDILVNNAAIREVVPATEVTDEQWKRHLDTVLGGAFYCCRAAIPHLQASARGRIVNILSIAVRQGHSVGAAPYTASKGGLLGLTRTLARELGDETLTVNAVSPATMRGSGLVEDFDEETISEIKSQYPNNKIPHVNEVAYIVSFLASERCQTMNGQTIEVNGGAFMS